MIAIPNMEKPKSCKECIDNMLNVVVDCYPDNYGEDKDGNKITCPLIEIVEDEYAKDILKDCYKITMCANYGNLTERWVNVGLIGERRIDERIKK